jgi:hypothetical protein
MKERPETATYSVATQEKKPEIVKALNLIEELLVTHWAEIVDIAGDDDAQEVGISLSLGISFASTTPFIKTKISFSRKFTDEASAYAEDPNQMTFEEELDNE